MQDIKLLPQELHEQTTSAYIAAARQSQGRGVDPDVQAKAISDILHKFPKKVPFNWHCIDAILSLSLNNMTYPMMLSIFNKKYQTEPKPVD